MITVFLKWKFTYFVKEILRKGFKAVTDWFCQNYMALNYKKYHNICTYKNTDQYSFTCEDLSFSSSKEEEILSVIIDKKLNFNNQIKDIFRKVSLKVSPFPRVVEHLKNDKKDFYLILWLNPVILHWFAFFAQNIQKA